MLRAGDLYRNRMGAIALVIRIYENSSRVELCWLLYVKPSDAPDDSRTPYSSNGDQSCNKFHVQTDGPWFENTKYLGNVSELLLKLELGGVFDGVI